MEAGTPKGIASQLDLDLDDISIALPASASSRWQSTAATSATSVAR
jgi:hypothetical protein